MRNWGKHIILLLIWSLSFMADRVNAHTGNELPIAKIGAHHYGLQMKVSADQADCCSKHLCAQSGHHLNNTDCCVHNNLPVGALPASVLWQHQLLFFDFEKPSLQFMAPSLCAGYRSVWLPPKVEV